MTPSSSRSRPSIRRRFLFGLGFALLMLGLIALIASRTTQRFFDAADLVARSRETLETGERFLRHLTEMEGSRRGFLITGHESYWREYERARYAMSDTFATLNSLAGDSPEERLRLERVKQLMARTIAAQRAEVQARRAAPAASGSDFFPAEAQTGAIQVIRAIIEDLATEQRRILAYRTALTHHVGAWTSRSIIIRSALALVALVAAGTMILRDIAARRRAEEALADQHNLLSSIIDTIPDHIYLKDVKGRYVLDNRAHRTYLRLDEDDTIVGKTVYDFFPEELAALYDQDDQHVIETGAAVRNREEPGTPTQSGELWLSTTKVPLREPDDRIIGLVCVSSDVTERRIAEEKLRRFADELERSNSELQSFASVASHDLQEPLRKIQAFGDRLKAKCADGLGEHGRDYLDRMQNAALRMQTLIQDLLKLSRVTSRAQPFERCDLDQIVREVISDLEVVIEQKNATIDLGALPIIDADPVQMRQLFQNLISNALKFQSPGATPQVAIEGTTFIATDLSTRGASAGDEVCRITVRDNGIGFDEQFAEQIFVVFQRLHGRNEFEGTGMGLAVCRKITDRHGGSLVAKSTEGEGATFIVTLPVRQHFHEAEQRENHADYDPDGR